MPLMILQCVIMFNQTLRHTGCQMIFCMFLRRVDKNINLKK
uniref:Uncharacterized protein n=1 Tax=Escherichia coli TaxID=562 RepID=A0A7U1E286_ECOLX|nr:hypothetical protein [Escherichia coli]